ncbi:MAG TPA: DUF72 domain-containing protein [Puia sp.]|nr:DUF72 domain-containing protein [Puia sp.]
MAKINKGVFRAGTSGLVLAEPNKSAFPKEFRKQTRLSYYSSLFNSIEINSSFYKMPMPATFAKWASEVGNAFQFTVKLGRDITHARGFEFRMEDIDKFMKAADNIGQKKGCLLIQLPPSITDSHADALEGMLHRVSMPDGDGSVQAPLFAPATADTAETDAGVHWKIAVEFRHPSWYRPGIYELLDNYQASVVLQDMPSSATRTLNKKAHFIYLRYHGQEGDYKGSYPISFLQQQAKDIAHWLGQGKDVYAYFNNTIGDAVANLNTLRKMVARD